MKIIIDLDDMFSQIRIRKTEKDKIEISIVYLDAEGYTEDKWIFLDLNKGVFEKLRNQINQFEVIKD